MNEDNDKKFDLKRAEDPDQVLAIRTRERACDSEALSDGAVRLFVRLLDLALHPLRYKSEKGGMKGRAFVSQDYLGALIHCDERTIRRRVTELILAGFIWVRLVPKKNTKPMCAYFISAFVPQMQDMPEVAGEGLYGNGKRRFDAGFAKTGSQAGGHQRRMVSSILDHHGRPVSLDLLENAAVRGQESPPSADKIDRSERTPVSAVRGQNCPLTEDKTDLSQRTELTAPSGQNCPVVEGAGVRQLRDSVGEGVGKGVGGDTPAPDLEQFAKSLKGLFPSWLEKKRVELQGKLAKATGPAGKKWCRDRLKLVEAELLGGEMPDETPAPRATVKSPEKRSELTAAELLESARNAVNLGATMLTAAQCKALADVGELPQGKAVAK